MDAAGPDLTVGVSGRHSRHDEAAGPCRVADRTRTRRPPPAPPEEGPMDWRAMAEVRNKFDASHNDFAAVIWRNQWCWRPAISPVDIDRRGTRRATSAITRSANETPLTTVAPTRPRPARSSRARVSAMPGAHGKGPWCGRLALLHMAASTSARRRKGGAELGASARCRVTRNAIFVIAVARAHI